MDRLTRDTAVTLAGFLLAGVVLVLVGLSALLGIGHVLVWGVP